jgi:RNA-directed DNA polymerase
LFHADSYGYRPGKSALDAVGKCRERCWRYDWVVDLDIRGFFDNIDHSLMMHAVCKHTDCPWVLLYIERWLKAPAEDDSGKREARTKGTPQGGVISPLLANLFLHHVFDEWMSREHPDCPFERYADDVVIHCRTLEQAQQVRGAVEQRLRECKLEAHPEKTRIVYCRDSSRRQDHEHIQFDFLGYTFRPRSSKRRRGIFTGFLPAISTKAKKAIVAEMRGWKLQRWTEQTLTALARKINPSIQGWINYYGRYYRSALRQPFGILNRRLVQWARRTYKRYRTHWRRATIWLRRLAGEQPALFAHWRIGIAP